MTLTTGYPPPSAFGLPAQFTAWRSHQVSAWQTILDAPTRFVAITAPTGAGKSLIYMTASALTDGRTVTLTGTKGLQNQLGYDYAEMGLLDIRGQSNYTCRAFEPGGEWQSLRPDDIKDRGCENGPCHVGLPCTLREAGCTYYDQIRMTLQADRVSTNYALWFAQKLYSKGLGEDLDLLVLDEAHVADAELSSALKIEFPHWLLKALSLKVPEGNVGVHGWQKWATYHAVQFKSTLDTKPTSTDKAALKYRQRLQKAERLLRSIMGMTPGEWVEDPTPDAYVFECLNPSKWAETVLFQGAGKVVFTSATLTEKTLTLLGVKPHDVTWFECPSDFPIERRPVIWVPTTKVDFKMTEAHWGQWVTRIDQILDQRPHVKGVIHTVSFARAKRLKEMSRHADRFILPGPGQTEGVVALFRKTPEHLGAVLVSPSVMTGWDFPDSQCRFQILAKLPFPDTRSKITQARQELDKDYGPYLMMQNLVQAVGRGMRSKTDWCETIIVDDNWAWVQGKYKKLAPAWFWAAVRKSITLPAPLDPATFAA